MNIKSKPIIQFSPIRSGSTLVYNILREFCNVTKTHHVRHGINNGKQYVITYRHPYNAIISALLRYQKKIDLLNIKSGISEYLNNGGIHLLKHDLSRANILLLKYEEYSNNYEVIYHKLERFLNFSINKDKRIALSEKYDVSNVKKMTDKYKAFSEYDKTTHLHGKHISVYNGKTDYKKILSKDEICALKENENLNKIVEKFDYKI